MLIFSDLIERPPVSNLKSLFSLCRVAVRFLLAKSPVICMKTS